MASQLFNDTIVAKPSVLDSPQDGKLRVRFKATQANVVNSNMRLYPHNVLTDAVERANELVRQNRMVGESPHPKHYVGKNGQIVFDTRVENSVIKIYNQFIDAQGVVYVDAVVLGTDKGKQLKALIEEGVPVGISMRALGDSVRKQINGTMVDVATRLDIHSYDVVMNPATPGCEVVQVLTDSQVQSVLSDGVSITTPACPDCGAEMKAMDPDDDGDLDFYFCPSCKEVYVPDETKSVTYIATQNLAKLPNDPGYDGWMLARRFKAGLLGDMGDEGMTDATLKAAERKNLKDSDFAVPGKRKLPIHDKEHVELAWKMVDRTKGLTAEERKEARKRILRRAKELGIDTSGWDKPKTDHAEGDDEELKLEDVLNAIKDSEEFKALVAEQAKQIAKPALDAVQAQMDAQARAEAEAKAKAETKAFVDEKLASLKGKVADAVLEIIADSVKDATSKETAGVIIDSVLNIYSKAASKVKLDAIGFDGKTTGEGGHVRVQVTNEPKPWEGLTKELLDSFDRIAEERGHLHDPSIRKVNREIVDKLIEAFEKKVGHEAMKDSAAWMDSVAMNDSVSVTTAQLLNQPTIQQAILIQAFQDVESLQFMITETFEGSEIRWPVETFTSAATVNPATGLQDIVVPEGVGIPESQINLSWLSYTPTWRRNAISLTTDVVNVLRSGPLKYDAIARALYHIAYDKRRRLDNAAYLEMIMAADEYRPTVVANETIPADLITAGAAGTNVAYVGKLTVGGAATATAGSNPVVRPRTKTQILPSGQTQTVTSNPFTVTVNGATKQLGYLDANGNVQGGDYAVDWENGVVYFAASAGLNPTATTPILPVVSYSAATNYDRWSFTVPSGMQADQYYNTLLQLITKEVAIMGSAPRFQRPNLGIMSLNVATYIENAAMWYKLNSPDLGSLSGLADSTVFGNRSGVNFARINAPWAAGDNRILLTQKGATRYAIETPYQIEGPYPKYDSNGNIVDAKVFYGRENSVLATPQTIDGSGNILNPKLRSIKITA